uniref:Small ribosomal subunit protein uS3c n=1 Tax=Mankyua chejuensis TaxID=996148 RepID=H8Y653_9MONI|nr:ribosomal protein S3 [Mankyua chejuensis]ADZ48021.1 ribosomal protein S3 [Mankyua chejuensis]AJJ48652.1 ribosomal protein S3 [Mankyua chejuensis]
MGQKIHPLGFRLGTTQNHCSHWFARPKDYSKSIEEDQKIRDCINKYIRDNMRDSLDYGGIARIEIKRKTDLVRVEIYTGFPDLFMEDHGLGIEQLKASMQNILNYKSQKLHLTIKEIEKPYGEPKILAEHIALQLEDRVSFRRAMRKAIELAERANNKGVKIQISGRLDGNEIARVEWAREGRVPLQTIRAHINYCCYPAQTIYGVLGIKVWVFQDDE